MARLSLRRSGGISWVLFLHSSFPVPFRSIGDKGTPPWTPVLLFLFAFVLLPFLFILSLNLKIEGNVGGTQQRPFST